MIQQGQDFETVVVPGRLGHFLAEAPRQGHARRETTGRPPSRAPAVGARVPELVDRFVGAGLRPDEAAAAAGRSGHRLVAARSLGSDAGGRGGDRSYD